MRSLALGTVVALLTWSADEAIAAARPSIPELPSAISIEEGSDAAPTTDGAPRAASFLRDPRPKAAVGVQHGQPREGTAPALGAWHPTRHARDDSPDH